jgi:hypothetical protein
LVTLVLAPTPQDPMANSVTLADPRLAFGAQHPTLPQRRLGHAEAVFVKSLLDKMQQQQQQRQQWGAGR